MRAGQLRDLLTIQSSTKTADTHGQLSPDSWDTTVGTAYAHIEPLTGQELFSARQTDPLVTHKITIRYHGDLLTKHRLTLGSRIFHPHSVMNIDNRNRTMVLICREAV